MNMMTYMINGIDTIAAHEMAETFAASPAKAQSRWHVTTRWMGGTRTDTTVSSCEIGGETIDRQFTLKTDEPTQIGGTNLYANPQEYLMAGVNACMIVAYTVNFAMEGVELEYLSIETSGEIDLRGAFVPGSNVIPGYDHLDFTVRVKGWGSPEQFRRVHEAVMATSPNFYNMTRAIPMRGTMEVLG